MNPKRMAMEEHQAEVTYEKARSLYKDDHPEWTEERLVIEALRFIAFDRSERSDHENNVRRFYRAYSIELPIPEIRRLW